MSIHADALRVPVCCCSVSIILSKVSSGVGAISGEGQPSIPIIILIHAKTDSSLAVIIISVCRCDTPPVYMGQGGLLQAGRAY